MAGKGGPRPGAGRPKGSTRKARYLGPVLAAEQSLFLLLPQVETCLSKALALGDVQAAALVLKYAMIPAERREDFVAALLKERMAEQDAEDAGDGEG